MRSRAMTEQVAETERSEHPSCILAHQGLGLCQDLERRVGAVLGHREGAGEMQASPCPSAGGIRALSRTLLSSAALAVWMPWL